MSKNRILSLCIMVFGAQLFWFADRLPPPALKSLVGPAFWPMAWGSVMLLLGTLLLMSTFVPFFAAQEKAAASSRSHGWSNYSKVIEVFLITFVYFLLMNWLGFVISSILYIVICVLCLTPRTPKNLVISTVLAVSLVVGLFCFFYYGMGTFLPPPVWQ
ncbi:hypothetical protein FACS1894206_02000 [Deltaproteobacteria bacterium]|nr:hypothetical protein FACS1894206_02000 [Deltaproteobacteria bacterium]